MLFTAVYDVRRNSTRRLKFWSSLKNLSEEIIVHFAGQNGHFLRRRAEG